MSDLNVNAVLQEACYQYWPSKGSKTFGEFTVELLGEEKLIGFIIRNFTVINKKVYCAVNEPTNYI